MEKAIFKNIFLHNIFICQPIFKIFVALFMTFGMQIGDRLIFFLRSFRKVRFRKMQSLKDGVQTVAIYMYMYILFVHVPISNCLFVLVYILFVPIPNCPFVFVWVQSFPTWVYFWVRLWFFVLVLLRIYGYFVIRKT